VLLAPQLAVTGSGGHCVSDELQATLVAVGLSGNPDGTDLSFSTDNKLDAREAVALR
jgi:hypothetical protein